jgi:hypothetical protein
MILEGETILDDHYPVFCGYAYVGDGRVVESPVEGTVRDLKRALGVSEVRRCELVKRQHMARAK